MGGMDKQYFQYMEQFDTEAIDTLIDWSNINSGSSNLSGLHTMSQKLTQHFSSLAKVNQFDCASYEVVNSQGQITQQATGNILTIKKRWQQAKTNIVLCGHMDTVFAEKDPFQTVNAMPNGILNGPGVADMKGGLLVIYYALLALEQTPFRGDIGWQVIINADEEVGSLGSANFLAKNAKQADIGLVFEPSMLPDGTFAGQRKGSGKFSIVVKGKKAHAGRAFYEGKNAICHLAEIVTEIHQHNDPKTGLTANVGIFSGGQALNVVPEIAVAKIDVRYSDDEEKQLFKNFLDDLVAKYNQSEGYEVACYGSFSRTAKPMTKQADRLFHLLKEVGQHLGQKVDWQPCGGCCDGNNLSALGLPVIDTLGVRGGDIHSDKEFMYRDSLIERSQLTLGLLLAIAQKKYKDI